MLLLGRQVLAVETYNLQFLHSTGEKKGRSLWAKTHHRKLIKNLLSQSNLRLFTVPYFLVRSFRYTASYRHGYLDFGMYRGGGHRGYSSGGWGGGGESKKNRYFSCFLPNRPRPLSSFDTHARWQPVTQSARSRWSYRKIEDCEQSSPILVGKFMQ